MKKTLEKLVVPGFTAVFSAISGTTLTMGFMDLTEGANYLLSESAANQELASKTTKYLAGWQFYIGGIMGLFTLVGGLTQMKNASGVALGLGTAVVPGASLSYLVQKNDYTFVKHMYDMMQTGPSF